IVRTAAAVVPLRGALDLEGCRTKLRSVGGRPQVVAASHSAAHHAFLPGIGNQPTTVGKIEPAQQPGDMTLDGAHFEGQSLSDLVVRQALADQDENAPLLR